MFRTRRSREADIERELRSHLELEEEEQRADGLSPEEARYAAQRAFGSTALVAEQLRGVWRRRWLDDVLQDLRYAVRLLARNRTFAAGAVVPLAFAIGCTACALTLVDAVLFRPLGIREPDRMAAVYAFSQQRNAFLSSSYPDFRDIESLNDLAESAAAFARIPVNVRLPEGTERFNSEIITSGYLRTVGVTPAAGRPLTAEDHLPGAPPVALVSHAFWEKRRLAGAPVLGSVIWIDGVGFTIVGVMPKGYAGTLLDWNANPAFWIPLAQIRQMLPPFRALDYENLRDMQWLMTIARLRAGVSLERLQAAADAVSKRVPNRSGVRYVAMPLNRARFFPGHRAATVRVLWILVAVSLAALAIACFNLANLLLARAAARQKEIGVRLALGAGRLRLLQQFSVENAVLALCACGLGLPFAFALTNSANAFQNAFGLSLDVGPDARALAASALAGIGTAILAGFTVLWNLRRLEVAGAVKEARIQGRVSVRDAFVAAQVACATVTLVAAVLLGQTLRNWASVPLGYVPHGILLGSLDTLSARLTAADKERLYRQLLTELRSEARGAALATDAMPSRARSRVEVSIDGGSRARTIDFTAVSDGYFQLLGTPILKGRDVVPGDDSRSRPVLVVNQTAAALFWPGQDAIGRHLHLRGEDVDREVVGVVADARYRPLGEAESSEPFAFVPMLQKMPNRVTIHALTHGEPQRFAGALRRIVGRVAGDMPLTDVEPLEERVEAGLAQVRLVSAVIGAVCAVGVALALSGILAAGAYRVAQRKREIAIRIAIGAEPRRVIRLFAMRGLAIGIAGALAGLLPAAWAALLVRSSLRAVVAPTPLLLASSAAALAVAAGAASWAVARRIARVQPADVLRVQ